MFQALDGAVELQLHLLGQGAAHALHVHFLGVLTAGFNKELVARLVGKAHHLVLKAGTVARSHALDPAGIERRAVNVFQDHLLGAVVRPADVAFDLVVAEALGLIGKRLRRLIALLHLQFGEVDRTAEHTRRRAGLKPAQGQAEVFERDSELGGRKHAVGSALVADLADVDPAAEIGAGGDNDRAAKILREHLRGDQITAVARLNVGDLRLTKLEILLQLELVLHDFAVLAAVDLRAQRVNSRTLSPVEHARLQKARVGCLAHLAAERVQLTDKVSLSSAADGRIARAVADRVHIDRKNSRVTAEPRGSQGGLDAGMSCADNGNIIFSCKVCHVLPLFIIHNS